jgi:hypothetical protein
VGHFAHGFVQVVGDLGVDAQCDSAVWVSAPIAASLNDDLRLGCWY